MVEETAPDGGMDTSAPVVTPASEGPINAREAGNAISAWREKSLKTPPAARAPDGKFAGKAEVPEPAKAAEPDAPALEQPSTETPDQPDEPAEVPPIDAPRSWTNEEKEAFRALPPEHQQRIADRERAREVEIRRGQNEAAEIRKAAETERQLAEQARQQYEQAAKSNLDGMHGQFARDFPEIKTQADLDALGKSDPFRWIEARTILDGINAKESEVKQLQQQRAEKEAGDFKAWSSEEDKKFVEYAKEFSDPVKAPESRKRVEKYLTEARGIPQETLPKLWNEPLFRDHRMQIIVWEAVQWQEAREKAAKATPRPLPPVQRPGVSPGKGDAAKASIEAAEKRLTGTKGIEAARAAADLMRARRSANAR